LALSIRRIDVTGAFDVVHGLLILDRFDIQMLELMIIAMAAFGRIQPLEW